MFFKIWLIILFFNQLFFYDLCFSFDCIFLALPHTGMIAIFIYYLYYGLKLVYRHYYPKQEDKKDIYPKILNSYDGILVALLAKVAKVDGRITKKEAEYMSTVYDDLSKERIQIFEIRKIYKDILQNEKDNLKNINELCLKLRYLNINHAQKVQIIVTLVDLAYIENKEPKISEAFIAKIVSYLALSPHIYVKILEKYKPKDSSINSYYKVLESKKEDSNQEIKTKYRKLVREYHTDILASKNLPKDMIAFAEEKLKEINCAYEEIKKERKNR